MDAAKGYQAITWTLVDSEEAESTDFLATADTWRVNDALLCFAALTLADVRLLLRTWKPSTYCSFGYHCISCSLYEGSLITRGLPST